MPEQEHVWIVEASSWPYKKWNLVLGYGWTKGHVRPGFESVHRVRSTARQAKKAMEEDNPFSVKNSVSGYGVKYRVRKYRRET